MRYSPLPREISPLAVCCPERPEHSHRSRESSEPGIECHRLHSYIATETAEWRVWCPGVLQSGLAASGWLHSLESARWYSWVNRETASCTRTELRKAQSGMFRATEAGIAWSQLAIAHQAEFGDRSGYRSGILLFLGTSQPTFLLQWPA
ncbi:hypothetical protein NDU88_001966 [Pleurodeles waltl]|uniref:Uncharacterized protein n=1 Tax=Pleurodeles waltl TaxID=8319 RepID=A0AAV7P8B3_PLEWA|nr:hypothetical protein NDU88_001966 [Pleurodeles waltl]